MSVVVAHRQADAGDREFIRSGWSRSYKHSHSAGMIAMDDWAEVMHPQIDKVLAHCRTLVAYKPDEEDRIADLYGFLAYVPTEETREQERPLVLYCYVALNYRGFKLARGLFRAAGIDPQRPFDYACKTAVVGQIQAKAKIPFARWRPLDARFLSERKDRDHG